MVSSMPCILTWGVLFGHVLLCRYSAGASANILWSAGVRVRSEVAAAIARLQAAGMPTMDISNMESAQVAQHATLLHVGMCL